jgi:hypothetical protein
MRAHESGRSPVSCHGIGGCRQILALSLINDPQKAGARSWTRARGCQFGVSQKGANRPVVPYYLDGLKR